MALPATGYISLRIPWVWQGTFNGNFEDKDYAIAIFNRHIEHVKKRVPPDKLLVYNVKQGWEPLCTFLGIQVPPDKPFPHLNERALPHGKSFFVRFKPLFSSNSALVCPSRPQRLSSALER